METDDHDDDDDEDGDHAAAGLLGLSLGGLEECVSDEEGERRETVFTSSRWT